MLHPPWVVTHSICNTTGSAGEGVCLLRLMWGGRGMAHSGMSKGGIQGPESRLTKRLRQGEVDDVIKEDTLLV